MQPIWSPNTQRVREATITRFQSEVQSALDGCDYRALHKWSTDCRDEFWSRLWDFAEIVGDKGNPPYLKKADHFPGSQWFPSARLNYAENLLRRRDDAVALVSVRESGERNTLTYSALYRRVAALAAAFRRDGIVAGDRIAAYVPNILDSTVAMLAAASLGAVWSSCSPDFGEQGLLDRFGQIEPKVLIVADGYDYNGKQHDSLARVKGILKSLPTVERIVVIPFLSSRPDLEEIDRAIMIEEYLIWEEEECLFERLPFDHPLFILYSSGTTGKPKCIIHSAGGALLEHQKEHLLHTDIDSEDVFFYFSTCGWMMWNWLVTGLAIGCTIVIYEGSPTYPDLGRLFNLIEEERITVFGTSARFISAVEKFGLEPGRDYDLASLKTILSTGSPLAQESFHFVYEKIKDDVLLSSISGGTDLLGAFVSGNPCLPVFAGQLQCAGLGMDVDVVDGEMQPLKGQKGELVCRKSFPSVPLGFWDDPDQKKFIEAYFSRFPGLWTHGDFAEITSDGGFVIHGRSDSVLNPGGIRIGTAEIYRQVEKVEQVLESIVVGQEWGNDCRIILFVLLRDGCLLDENLEQVIKSSIKNNTTPRHVPSKIIQVSDIPRTLSGKIAELAVRNVIHNRPVGNRQALSNPESLSIFADLDELRS